MRAFTLASCCCDDDDCSEASECTTCEPSEVESLTAEVIVAGAGDCAPPGDCAGLCDAINATYFPSLVGMGSACLWQWEGDGTDFDGYCPVEIDTPCLRETFPYPPPYSGPGYREIFSYGLNLRIEHLKSFSAQARYGFPTPCNTRVSVSFWLCTGFDAPLACSGIVGIGFYSAKWIEGRADCADIVSLTLDDELLIDGPQAPPNPCGWPVFAQPFVDCSGNVQLVHTWDGESWDGREGPYDGECGCAGDELVPGPHGGRHACDFSGLSVTVSLS